MNEWLDNILLNYVTFVSLFSPPATITAATIILGRIDRNILWQIAWKIAAGYTLVMLVVIWLGNWLLTALGLSADALTVTGGIALLAQGWPMLIRGVKEEHSDIPVSVTPPKDIMRLAMVPLLFPLSMGGGTIAVGISLAGHSDSLSGLIQLSVVILLIAHYCADLSGNRAAARAFIPGGDGYPGADLRHYSGYTGDSVTGLGNGRSYHNESEASYGVIKNKARKTGLYGVSERGKNYTSMFAAFRAFSSIKARRGSTSSPISVVNN
ncbi:TPA: MarC family protein [Morganella morganii]